MTARTSSHEAELLGGSTAERTRRHYQDIRPMRARTSSPEAEFMEGRHGNDETANTKYIRTIETRLLTRTELPSEDSTGNGGSIVDNQIGSQIIATSSSVHRCQHELVPQHLFEIYTISHRRRPEYAPGPMITFKVPSPTSSDDDSELDLQSQQVMRALLSHQHRNRWTFNRSRVMLLLCAINIQTVGPKKTLQLLTIPPFAHHLT